MNFYSFYKQKGCFYCLHNYLHDYNLTVIFYEYDGDFTSNLNSFNKITNKLHEFICLKSEKLMEKKCRKV